MLYNPSFLWSLLAIAQPLFFPLVQITILTDPELSYRIIGMLLILRLIILPHHDSILILFFTICCCLSVSGVFLQAVRFISFSSMRYATTHSTRIYYTHPPAQLLRTNCALRRGVRKSNFPPPPFLAPDLRLSLEGGGGGGYRRCERERGWSACGGLILKLLFLHGKDLAQ
jgi:hypothetical protein